MSEPKRLNVDVAPEFLKWIKTVCVIEDITIKDLTTAAIKEYIETNYDQRVPEGV